MVDHEVVPSGVTRLVGFLQVGNSRLESLDNGGAAIIRRRNGSVDFLLSSGGLDGSNLLGSR